jgi:probable F420-dependent oxidoreductase
MQRREPVRPALSMQPANFAAKDPGSGGWHELLDFARGADAAGLDRLVVADHVVFGENLDAYADPKKGGTRGGRQPTGSDGHWLEPLTLLSVFAGITENIRLMTGILLAGLRRPATLAKTTATLDVLSQGRLDLGVGVGWQREEYEANGIPHERRGDRLDHTLEICQLLWREEVAAHASAEVNFTKIHMQPKHVQPGGVPIWIGGSLHTAAIRRIVRFGSGWIPWGPDAADPAAGLGKIRSALDAAGRDSRGFEVTAYLPAVKNDSGGLDRDATMQAVPAMVEAGITDFRIRFPLPKEADAVRDAIAPVVETFRRAAGRT